MSKNWLIERDKLSSKVKKEYTAKNFQTGEAINVSIACSKFNDPTHGSCQLVSENGHGCVLFPLASTIEFLKSDISKAKQKYDISEFFEKTTYVVEALQDLEYEAYRPQFHKSCVSDGKDCEKKPWRSKVNSDWYREWHELNIKEAMDELIDSGILDLKMKKEDGSGCCLSSSNCDK